MKKYDVLFIESAKAEIKEIFLWYEKQKEGLGVEFITETEKVIETLSNFPYSFAEVYLNFRRVLTNVFPYYTKHAHKLRFTNCLTF